MMRLLLMGSLILATLSGSAHAAEEADARERQERWQHVLGGHAYPPSFVIPSPFIDAHATIALGVGVGTYDRAILGSVRDLKLGTFQPVVDGQFRILDRLALGFGVRGSLTAGLSTTSAIDYGASVAYTARIGALYRIQRSRAHELSLGLDVSKPRTYSVSPLEAAAAGIRSVVRQGDLEFATEAVTVRWSPSLRLAYTFSEALGLRSFVGFRFDSTKENEERVEGKTLLTLGLGLSGALDPWVGVPIVLTANYRRGQAVSSDGSSSNVLTLGLFETLADSFDVGAEGGIIRQGSVDTTLFSLMVRAYFD